jgi:translation initiation factor 1
MTSRTVYSSDKGRICPGCGWPASNCQCSNRSANAAVPARIVAKLRMEKKGRGGKMVTVIDGLPRNDAFLRDLAQELKRSCGTGGTIADGEIELHGDLRERLREVLTRKGFTVKG